MRIGPFPRPPSGWAELERPDPVGHGVDLSNVHGEVVLYADVVLSAEVDFVPHFPYDPLFIVVVVTLEGVMQ